MDGVSGPDPAGRRRNCTACIAGHYLCRGIGGKSGGKLQGVLVSLTNLTGGVAGPLLFAFIFSQTQQSADGTVWLIGTALYGLLLAICLLIRKPAPVAATC